MMAIGDVFKDMRPENHFKGVAVEVEAFGDMSAVLKTEDMSIPFAGMGSVECDVGVNQGEFIGDIRPNLCDAFQLISDMMDSFPGMQLKPFRPDDVPGKGEWLFDRKPAVKAFYEGLQLECRKHKGLDFSKIRIMPDAAGIHINVSGDFNPMGPEGLFLINVLNHTLPFVARMIHRVQGMPRGHLAIWRGYALPGRFPQYGEWLPTPKTFKMAFESLPRLIGKRGDEFISRPEGEFSELGNVLDHGRWWKLARPKPIWKDGKLVGWYLEIRVLPAWCLGVSCGYGNLVLRMAAFILDWYFEHAQEPVMTIEAAEPLFRELHREWPDVMPTSIPSRQLWTAAFHG